MWICPVCGTENQADGNCRQCGFDRSTDYIHYPTLYAGSSYVQSPPPKARDSALRCSRCRNDRFIIRAEEGACVCTQCHNIMPLSVPQVQQPLADDSADEEDPVSAYGLARRFLAAFVLIAFLACITAITASSIHSPLYAITEPAHNDDVITFVETENDDGTKFVVTETCGGLITQRRPKTIFETP